MFLSLVDEHHTPWRDDMRYLSADVLCTSRDLPLMLLQQEQGNFVMPDSIPVGQLKLCRPDAAASGAPKGSPRGV